MKTLLVASMLSLALVTALAHAQHNTVSQQDYERCLMYAIYSTAEYHPQRNPTALALNYDRLKQLPQKCDSILHGFMANQQTNHLLKKLQTLYQQARKDGAVVDLRSQEEIAQEQEQIEMQRLAKEPVTCPKTKVKGMKGEKRKALLYVVQRKLDLGDRRCLTDIEVTDSFPVNGNTVVKYVFTVSYPHGYRTTCFNMKDPNEDYWGNFLQKTTGGCNAVSSHHQPLGAPAKPGETRRYSDEVQI